jgi:uncharacterized protein (DUF433 family)
MIRGSKMATVYAIGTIVADPAVRGGQPVIMGTTIRIIDLIASYLYRGLGAEELATNYQLDLGQVHAALAYYYQHKAEIDRLVRDEASQSKNLLKELEQQGKLIRIE